MLNTERNPAIVEAALDSFRSHIGVCFLVDEKSSVQKTELCCMNRLCFEKFLPFLVCKIILDGLVLKTIKDFCMCNAGQVLHLYNSCA